MVKDADSSETELFEELITFEFHCRDTGIGMSDTTLKKLFQPFKQADSSTTRRFGGTGYVSPGDFKHASLLLSRLSFSLGLAITKTLVHSMDGEVIVMSEEGHGTEFIWYLPLVG